MFRLGVIFRWIFCFGVSSRVFLCSCWSSGSRVICWFVLGLVLSWVRVRILLISVFRWLYFCFRCGYICVCVFGLVCLVRVRVMCR